MDQIEARNLITPFYNLFRSTDRDWDKGFAVLAEGWRSYYTNELYRTKADTRPYIEGLFEIVPDINVEIHEIAVDGDVIAVRSELSGTPVREFMVPVSGRSFHIMTIDMHRVGPDGTLATLYHLEDWGTAIRQLGAGAGTQEGGTA